MTMKRITLTISEIDRLNSIQNLLSRNKSVSTEDKVYLAEFLNQIPTVQSLLADKTPLSEAFEICVWDMHQLEVSMEKWRKLFAKTPGWDYSSFCYLVVQEDKTMLSKNVIAIAQFAPSMAYNLDASKEGYEVWLKDDGTALFFLPTLADAEKYPELYNFKGSWKEAYLLLIETLKKGWPMEEFPDELKPFLKK
jgi:hypothetical protein